MLQLLSVLLKSTCRTVLGQNRIRSRCGLQLSHQPMSKRECISTDIAHATQCRIYRKVKPLINTDSCTSAGKTPTFPFWDLIVLSAADEEQRMAFRLQLDGKIKRAELPLNTEFLISADPGTVKVGPGGSMMYILSELPKLYGNKLSRMKVLIIPAGGYSQRLPCASLLGKIFTALPLGNPMYDLLDAKLASLIEFPAKMDYGIFMSCADTVELYDCKHESNWRFPSSGITAQGHPSPINIGTTHGVFVMASQQKECGPRVEVVECLRFLHKKSKAELIEQGACLHPTFANLHGTNDEMVLTDSGFFMDITTAFKLIAFYQAEAPLECEIDTHGDFLQALGPQATSDYITNTSNVCSKTSSLTEMRLKVYNLLKGTPLNVLVQSHSQFFHIGTTAEYLDHLCSKSDLALELGFKHDTFNKKSDNTKKQAQQSSPCDSPQACVMHSVLPDHFDWSHPCIVEFCYMRGRVSIQDNCIISNCCISALPEDSVRIIPAHSFLHTACIKGQNRYVTFVFDVRDNMKQSTPRSEAEKLVFMNNTFKEIFGDCVSMICNSLFSDANKDNYSIWQAKLFRPASSMEDAFDAAMMLLEQVHAEKVTLDFEGCLSMANILKQKEVSAMIYYRQSLYDSIKD